jgi:metal-sulfur cluster biosynthetic enzyme
MPLQEHEVMTALRDCYDPEIPVNIVDLGLIYEIRLSAADPPAAGASGVAATSAASEASQDVEVVMTMTSPGCPAHVQIGDQVKERIQRLPGVREVSVNIVWTPPWGPERLSEAAKKQLGIE